MKLSHYFGSYLNHIKTHLPMFINMIRDVNKIIMDNRKPDMKIDWKVEVDFTGY